jgi:hypothetical protein
MVNAEPVKAASGILEMGIAVLRSRGIPVQAVFDKLNGDPGLAIRRPQMVEVMA